jgi:hypothetical protein
VLYYAGSFHLLKRNRSLTFFESSSVFNIRYNDKLSER